MLTLRVNLERDLAVQKRVCNQKDKIINPKPEGSDFLPFLVNNSSSRIAGHMRRTQAQMQGDVTQTLPPALTLNIDPIREGRLRAMTEGLFDTTEQATTFAHKVADLRQAAGTVASFRQALWLLLKVDNVEPPKRMELTRRAMAWYRARGIAEGNVGSPWAKSMVAIAWAQRGSL